MTFKELLESTKGGSDEIQKCIDFLSSTGWLNCLVGFSLFLFRKSANLL